MRATARATERGMRVAIAGSSGLLGRAVAGALRARGDAVTRVVRSRDAAGAPDALYWDPGARTIDAEALSGHDAVLSFAGENIAGVWTRAKKRRIRASRVEGTRLLAETLAALPGEGRPATFVAASGAHYYGDRPADVPLAEDATPGEGFMADLVRAWEAAAIPAREAGVRVVQLRFGVVLARDALLVQASALATRLGLGATLGDGSHPFPWITLDDVVGIVLFALDSRLEGPVNAAAPQRTTNRDYTDTLARVLGRPRFLAIPELALRLLGDLGTEVMLGGAWVVPRKLEAAGYVWRDPHLEAALRRLLNRP